MGWGSSAKAAGETWDARRACTNPSYDEKKRKKSHIASGDFFPQTLPITLRLDALKAAKLPAIEGAMTQHYRTPTSEFQIAATSPASKGWLLAHVDGVHGFDGNVLLLWSSY
jgi:hypothetical protein